MSNGIKAKNRPQARDDSAIVGEDGIVVIDALANDRGNPQTLWSVGQDDPSSQDRFALLPSGATVGTSGKADRIVYKTNGAFDYLAEGETATDSFTYSIRMGDGTYSMATVNVLIQGVNDPAIIDATSVYLFEGDSADDLSTSGTIFIDDVDGPEAFIASTQQGQFGTLTLDEAGNWTYTSYSAHDEFEADHEYHEAFTIYSADGTESFVSLTFFGTAEAPAAMLHLPSDLAFA